MGNTELSYKDILFGTNPKRKAIIFAKELIVFPTEKMKHIIDTLNLAKSMLEYYYSIHGIVPSQDAAIIEINKALVELWELDERKIKVDKELKEKADNEEKERIQKVEEEFLSNFGITLAECKRLIRVMDENEWNTPEWTNAKGILDEIERKTIIINKEKEQKQNKDF